MQKPTQSLTRSYSRKVQMKQFEPVEVFASETYQWFDEYPTPQEVQEKGKELFEICKEMVESNLTVLFEDAPQKDVPF